MYAVPSVDRTNPPTIIFRCNPIYRSASASSTLQYPYRCIAASNRDKTPATVITIPTLNNSFFMLHLPASTGAYTVLSYKNTISARFG